MKELKSHSVIVWLESKAKEAMELSPLIYSGLENEAIGNYIPRFVITDPKSVERWAEVSYNAISGGKSDAFRDVKKRVKEKLEGWEPGASEPVIPEEILKWPTQDKRFYSGQFVKLAGENVVLLDKKGKEFRLGLNKVSQASQDYARELGRTVNKEVVAEKIAEEMPELVIETWVSTDGKEIEATFEKFEVGQISLRMADGKIFTFPIERLDDKSGQRAQQLFEQISKAKAVGETAQN